MWSFFLISTRATFGADVGGAPVAWEVTRTDEEGETDENAGQHGFDESSFDARESVTKRFVRVRAGRRSVCGSGASCRRCRSVSRKARRTSRRSAKSPGPMPVDSRPDGRPALAELGQHLGADRIHLRDDAQEERFVAGEQRTLSATTRSVACAHWRRTPSVFTIAVSLIGLGGRRDFHAIDRLPRDRISRGRCARRERSDSCHLRSAAHRRASRCRSGSRYRKLRQDLRVQEVAIRERSPSAICVWRDRSSRSWSQTVSPVQRCRLGRSSCFSQDRPRARPRAASRRRDRHQERDEVARLHCVPERMGMNPRKLAMPIERPPAAVSARRPRLNVKSNGTCWIPL